MERRIRKLNGKIINNRAHCPFCEAHNYRIGDIKWTPQGTQVTGICRQCDREFEYLLEMKVHNEETRRFTGIDSDENSYSRNPIKLARNPIITRKAIAI